MDIIYKPNTILNLTGDTNYYSHVNSAITSGIIVYNGFTLNIDKFENKLINRIDILDNVINYVIDDINKYMLDILIFDENQIYDSIHNINLYCIKISYTNEFEQYLMMNIISNDKKYLTTTTTTIPITTTTTTIKINTGVNTKKPIIYYNVPPESDATWIGSGTTVPYDIFLNLYHDNLTGWTLTELKELFIEGVTVCFNEIINNISFILYEKGSNVPLSGISHNGVYDIVISAVDNANNKVINYLSNIIVDDTSPNIIFRPNVLSTNLTGYTNSFSGVTDIEPNINIDSGFTLYLYGFDNYVINKLDIIDNIVNYVEDVIDLDINKYMIDVLIVGCAFSYTDNKIYDNIVNAGNYCVKMKLNNSRNNEEIYYFIMNVVHDISIYSEGYWQDNKVWIDYIHWVDRILLKN